MTFSGLCQKIFVLIFYHPVYALKGDQKESDGLSEAQTKLLWGAVGVEPPPLLLFVQYLQHLPHSQDIAAWLKLGLHPFLRPGSWGGGRREKIKINWTWSVSLFFLKRFMPCRKEVKSSYLRGVALARPKNGFGKPLCAHAPSCAVCTRAASASGLDNWDRRRQDF